MKLQKVFSSRVGSRVLRLCVLGLFTLAFGAFRPVLAATGPDLTIAKSHVGDFTEGDTGKTYTITVTNIGNTTTSGTVTVADFLPVGLTATGFSGTGWSCTLDPLECTRSDALAATASFPDLTLTVDVDVNADPSVTNEAEVSNSGDVDPNNNLASDPTTIVQVADLTINKSHTGNFTQGEQGKTYTITVTNNGDGSTNGLVTVTDSLPTGLTATAISGAGWNCSTPPTLTCTRSDVLDPTFSYPAITLTVNVAYNAPDPVTNEASVGGGGEANAANNTDSDLTTVIQKSDLIITGATLSDPSPAPGEPFDINITVKNQGSEVTESIVYRDVFIDVNPSPFVDQDGCVSIDSDYFRGDFNDTLPPGVSDTKAVSISNGLSAGTHQIWVYTDATCINGESIENNNVYGPITVGVVSVTTTIRSTGSQDGRILETRENSNRGGTKNSNASLLYIGDDTANKQYRSILSFNTSALPDNAVITSAILKFKYAGKTGTLPFSTHGKLVVDIRKGAFGNKAILQINDFQAAANKKGILLFTNSKVSNWYSKAIAPVDFPYINLAGLTQFRLRFAKDDNHDFGADYLKIYSGNAGLVNRPQLIIEYYVP